MKLSSKYFDSIRVSNQRGSRATKRQERAPDCMWKGCTKPGPHKAPVGRGRDGEYFNFCIDHVRQYNQSYNYFDGMSDSEIEQFRKDAITGHRPTWKAGENAWGGGERKPGDADAAKKTKSRSAPRKPRSSRTGQSTYKRRLKPLERKALDVMNLPESATQENIKTRYKELVKIHHPDANGGDSRSEEKLREIIQAYNYLKQSGLV